MEKDEYKSLVSRLRAHHRIMGSITPINDWKKDMGLAAAAIEELLEAVERQNNIVRVETPFGAIIARSSAYGEDYPGMSVDLRRSDADHDLPLALVEFQKDGSRPEFAGHIVTHVYRDALAEECTDHVVHEKIEEYFKIVDLEMADKEENQEKRGEVPEDFHCGGYDAAVCAISPSGDSYTDEDDCILAKALDPNDSGMLLSGFNVKAEKQQIIGFVTTSAAEKHHLYTRNIVFDQHSDFANALRDFILHSGADKETETVCDGLKVKVINRQAADFSMKQ